MSGEDTDVDRKVKAEGASPVSAPDSVTAELEHIRHKARKSYTDLQFAWTHHSWNVRQASGTSQEEMGTPCFYESLKAIETIIRSLRDNYKSQVLLSVVPPEAHTEAEAEPVGNDPDFDLDVDSDQDTVSDAPDPLDPPALVKDLDSWDKDRPDRLSPYMDRRRKLEGGSRSRSRSRSPGEAQRYRGTHRERPKLLHREEAAVRGYIDTFAERPDEWRTLTEGTAAVTVFLVESGITPEPGMAAERAFRFWKEAQIAEEEKANEKPEGDVDGNGTEGGPDSDDDDGDYEDDWDGLYGGSDEDDTDGW